MADLRLCRALRVPTKCRDRDLCACHTGEFEHKNYFDLDFESSTEFVGDFWVDRFSQEEGRAKYS